MVKLPFKTYAWRMRILVSCSWSFLAAAATSCVKAHSDLIAWDGKIFGRDLSFEILDDFVYILNFEIGGKIRNCY